MKPNDGRTKFAPADVEQSLSARFEKQLLLHPHQRAVGSGDWQPTYAELNAAANRLAHALIEHGNPGDRVVLLMRHDAPLFAAVMGVLKAGRVVVVLNPTDPVARLDQVLTDAEPRLVVADPVNQTLAEQLVLERDRLLVFERDEAAETSANPTVAIAPSDLAALIYTSGSTGRPKGVMHSHRNFLHHVLCRNRPLAIGAGDRISLLAGLSSGHGLGSLFFGLLQGGTVCPFPIMERGIAGLAAWLRQEKTTAFVTTVPVFRQVVKTLQPGDRFPDIRLVRLGTEPATAHDFAAFQRHFPADCLLFHTFSMGEVHSVACLQLQATDAVADGRLPVGRPVEGVEVHLLDGQGQAVGPGEPGEIVVRSRYLSPGYWRNQALTAQRFSGPVETDLRTYRSGDLGRTTPDGLLMYLGRKDQQIKLRGYRIEPSEVEAAILQQPGVERAVIGLRGTAEEAQLFAYVVVRAGQTCSASALRRALRTILPAYMVPAGFVFLDELPLMAHGKLDREQLLRLSPAPSTEGPSEGPRTETEVLLAGIWAEVLALGTIDRGENFFELGGDSLRAMLVAARVQSACGVELDWRAFADSSTLESLARHIDLRRSSCTAPAQRLVRVSRSGPLPPSYAQERVWDGSQTAEGLAGWTFAVRYRLRGPLDVETLRASLNFVFRRHEILRTSFPAINGRPMQVIHPPAPVPVPFFDLAGETDPEDQARHVFGREAARPFNLAELPLVRFHLVRIRPDEYWLLRYSHHILSDAWSWKVFFRELGLVYAALRRGEAPTLAEFEPLQYADYAAWQRRTLRPDGPAYQKTVAWWKQRLARPSSPLEMPIRRSQPRPEANPAEGCLDWTPGKPIAERLDALARTEGATFYAVRLAAFVAVLAGETNQSDVVLGTYVTNRNRPELQSMFGFFANLVTLRLQVDPTRTFRQWLALVRDVLWNTQTHGEIPYERLCKELRQAKMTPPEVRLIFSGLEQAPPVHLGDAELLSFDRSPTVMPWGFTLDLTPGAEEHWSIRFDAGMYDPDRVRSLLSRFVQVLDAVSRQPDLPLNRLLSRKLVAA